MHHIAASGYPHHLSKNVEFLSARCKGQLKLLLNLKLLSRISQTCAATAQINENGFECPRTALVRANEYGKLDLLSGVSAPLIPLDPFGMLDANDQIVTTRNLRGKGKETGPILEIYVCRAVDQR